MSHALKSTHNCSTAKGQTYPAYVPVKKRPICWNNDNMAGELNASLTQAFSLCSSSHCARLIDFDWGHLSPCWEAGCAAHRAKRLHAFIKTHMHGHMRTDTSACQGSWGQQPAKGFTVQNLYVSLDLRVICDVSNLVSEVKK